jgi:hypothetical protein
VKIPPFAFCVSGLSGEKAPLTLPDYYTKGWEKVNKESKKGGLSAALAGVRGN